MTKPMVYVAVAVLCVAWAAYMCLWEIDQQRTYMRTNKCRLTEVLPQRTEYTATGDDMTMSASYKYVCAYDQVIWSTVRYGTEGQQ